jgi:hypothetical protein
MHANKDEEKGGQSINENDDVGMLSNQSHKRSRINSQLSGSGNKRVNSRSNE